METTSQEEIGLICPKCGYDLRATESGRCNECGREFSKEDLERPGFPWARKKGAWGYVLTAIRVMFKPWTYQYEGHKRQDFKLARGCRRISALLFGLALVVLSYVATNGLLAGGVTAGVKSPAEIVEELQLIKSSLSQSYPFLWEIQVAWAKAMQIPGLWEILLFIAGVDWVYAMGGMLRNRKASDIRKEQGRSMASYLSAIFFWPALAIGILIIGVSIKPLPRNFYSVAALGLGLWVWGMCSYRVIQWRMRLFNKGWVDGLFTWARMGAELVGRAVFWLVFLPFVAGYAMIIFWSLGLK